MSMVRLLELFKVSENGFFDMFIGKILGLYHFHHSVSTLIHADAFFQSKSTGCEQVEILLLLLKKILVVVVVC